MVNNKLFSHRPISELLSIVKNDFKKLDEEGLIDDGTIIKTVLYCNEKLGLPVREIKEVCIPVNEYKAALPEDFEKLYYVCALEATNTIVHNMVNPFDNNFDRDIIYDAKLDRETIGGVTNYSVTIKRQTATTIHHHDNWIALSLDDSAKHVTHSNCPNLKNRGKYTVHIEGDDLVTPFRTGSIFLIYIGALKDEEGNILFPFHPMITPYYEWAIKEKVLMDAVFNAEGNYGELLKLAQQERAKAWLDAFNITMDKGFGEYVNLQRKKEHAWYQQWYKIFD